MKDSNQVITKRPNGTIRVQTLNAEPSMTQQQFADECDINNIIKRYTETGTITHLARTQGIYADFSEITDFQGMLDQVRFANEAFMTLPAEVRKRFGNDPQQLLDFMHDPKNLEEGIKLGLFNPKTESVGRAITNDDLNDDPKPKPKQKQKQQQQPDPEKPDET